MKEIPIHPLWRNITVLVDDETYEWASRCTWHWKDGYAYRIVSQKPQKVMSMHRELMGLGHGSTHHVGMEVDHINRNRLDNRRSNLRIVTRSQNMQNKSPYRGSKTGIRGVYFDTSTRGPKNWRAKVQIGRKATHVGWFLTKDEAEAAVKFFRAWALPWSEEWKERMKEGYV